MENIMGETHWKCLGDRQTERAKDMGVFMRLGFGCSLGFGSGFGNLSRQPCPNPSSNPSVSCWVSGFFFWFFGTFSNDCSYQWVSLERQGICVNCRLLLGASPRIGSENEKISAESHSLFLSYKRFFQDQEKRTAN